MADLPIVPASGWYYHGVQDDKAFDLLCRGVYVLRISPPKSDPGDLGRGLYITSDLDEAMMYGYGKVMLVYAKIDRALELDFKGPQKSDARAWIDAMSALYGSPVRGRRDEYMRVWSAWAQGGEVGTEPPDYDRLGHLQRDRLIAADAWRAHLLRDGIGGLKVRGWDLGDTLVLFNPEQQVQSIECLPVSDE
jgi:hypothetical protein